MSNEQKNDGFRRLTATALEKAAETVDDIIECSEEVGLAKLVFCAMRVVAKIGQHEHERVAFIPADETPPDQIEASTSLYVSSTSAADDHVDFAIWAFDHRGRFLGQPGWRRAIVEIELSGSAPEISSSFLGRGRDGKDVHVLRFTAEEVMSDPWGSATKIFDWASWSFG
jgi:hypothetical protein